MLKDFGISVKIDPRTLCIAPLGTCFWFRPDALKKLFKGYEGKGWDYTDFPCEPNRTDWTILHAVERSYAYFAQDAGYYPVFLYSDDWAAVEFTNLELKRTSSVHMKDDMNKMVDDAIYGRTSLYEQPCIQTDYDAYNVSQTNFIGIRDSLNLLSNAVKNRHYGLWKAIAPIRFIGHKYFQHKYDCR